MDKRTEHKGKTFVETRCTAEDRLFYLSCFVFTEVDEVRALGVQQLVHELLTKSFDPLED